MKNAIQNTVEVLYFQNYKSNKILENLKLKDFEFYNKSIGIQKSIYDQLLADYQKYGKFNYFDIRNEGEITETKVVDSDNSKYIALTATISGKIKSFREIKVYDDGRMDEKEWNNSSKLRRTRTILPSVE